MLCIVTKHLETSSHPGVVKNLYSGLVCPHLKLGMSIANLNFKCDIESLEKV